MVLIPKKTKRAILELFLKEGVICMKHEPKAGRHKELQDVPKLHVMMGT